MESGKSILSLSEKPLADAEIAANMELGEGRPADVISHFASEGDFDLIIVGNRGQGKQGAAGKPFPRRWCVPLRARCLSPGKSQATEATAFELAQLKTIEAMLDKITSDAICSHRSLHAFRFTHYTPTA